MAKRISFAQKLEEVASIYDIRKLTLTEALNFNNRVLCPGEIEAIKKDYKEGKFAMSAEAKPGKADIAQFQRIFQMQDPKKKGGYHFFVTNVLYSTL
jgi:hypothetical protein